MAGPFVLDVLFEERNEVLSVAAAGCVRRCKQRARNRPTAAAGGRCWRCRCSSPRRASCCTTLGRAYPFWAALPRPQRTTGSSSSCSMLGACLARTRSTGTRLVSGCCSIASSNNNCS